ncbi:MAG: serine hydrolase [bacterium]|nr:serine hydrolase [bacterium]
MRLRLAMCALLIAMASAISTAAPFPKAKLDRLIAAEMKRWEIPGLAIAVVKDGKIVLEKGYGLRNVRGAETVDEHTLFGIASNSKTFTCAAISMLVDEDKLHWDDRVVDVLPGFKLADPIRAGELTLRDLAAHRTGVQTADRAWWLSQFTRAEMLRRMRYLEDAEPVRTTPIYNNLMLFAAGMALESSSGMTWDEFIQSRIFKPLGMNDSLTSVAQLTPGSDFAAPHARNDAGALVPTVWYNCDHVGPAASIVSSAHDMALWLNFLLAKGVAADGSRQLSEKGVAEMMTPQMVIRSGFESIGRKVRMHAYGLGLRLHEYDGDFFADHGGHIVTFRSFVCMLPDRDAGVVVLTNSETDFPHALGYTVADWLRGAKAGDWIGAYWKNTQSDREEIKSAEVKREADRVPNAPPSHPLEAYTGVYENPLYGTIAVTLKDGRLFHCYNETPHFRGELIPWNYDVFLLDPELDFRDKELVTFHEDASGAIASVQISGTEYKKKKE